MSIDINLLKNTVDKNATVLDGMRSNLSEVKERVIRLESKVS